MSILLLFKIQFQILEVNIARTKSCM